MTKERASNDKVAKIFGLDERVGKYEHTFTFRFCFSYGVLNPTEVQISCRHCSSNIYNDLLRLVLSRTPERHKTNSSRLLRREVPKKCLPQTQWSCMVVERKHMNA